MQWLLLAAPAIPIFLEPLQKLLALLHRWAMQKLFTRTKITSRVATEIGLEAFLDYISTDNEADIRIVADRGGAEVLVSHADSFDVSVHGIPPMRGTFVPSTSATQLLWVEDRVAPLKRADGISVQSIAKAFVEALAENRVSFHTDCVDLAETVFGGNVHERCVEILSGGDDRKIDQTIAEIDRTVRALVKTGKRHRGWLPPLVWITRVGEDSSLWAALPDPLQKTLSSFLDVLKALPKPLVNIFKSLGILNRRGGGKTRQQMRHRQRAVRGRGRGGGRGGRGRGGGRSGPPKKGRIVVETLAGQGHLIELLSSAARALSENTKTRSLKVHFLLDEEPSEHHRNGNTGRPKVITAPPRPIETVLREVDGDPNRLLSVISDFLLSQKFHERTSTLFQKVFLLHGPPGNGKTSLLQAIAIKNRLPYYFCDLSKDCTLKELRDKLKFTLPKKCIVVVEDAESAFKRSNDEATDQLKAMQLVFAGGMDSGLLGDNTSRHAASQESKRIDVQDFVKLIHSFGDEPHGRIICFTTNHVTDLPAEILRCVDQSGGRFRFSNPSLDLLKQYWMLFFQDAPDVRSTAETFSANFRRLHCERGERAAKEALADASDLKMFTHSILAPQNWPVYPAAWRHIGMQMLCMPTGKAEAEVRRITQQQDPARLHELLRDRRDGIAPLAKALLALPEAVRPYSLAAMQEFCLRHKGRPAEAAMESSVLNFDVRRPGSSSSDVARMRPTAAAGAVATKEWSLRQDSATIPVEEPSIESALRGSGGAPLVGMMPSAMESTSESPSTSSLPLRRSDSPNLLMMMPSPVQRMDSSLLARRMQVPRWEAREAIDDPKYEGDARKVQHAMIASRMPAVITAVPTKNVVESVLFGVVSLGIVSRAIMWWRNRRNPVLAAVASHTTAGSTGVAAATGAAALGLIGSIYSVVHRRYIASRFVTFIISEASGEFGSAIKRWIHRRVARNGQGWIGEFSTENPLDAAAVALRRGEEKAASTSLAAAARISAGPESAYHIAIGKKDALDSLEIPLKPVLCDDTSYALSFGECSLTVSTGEKIARRKEAEEQAASMMSLMDMQFGMDMNVRQSLHEEHAANKGTFFNICMPRKCPTTGLSSKERMQILLRQALHDKVRAESSTTDVYSRQKVNQRSMWVKVDPAPKKLSASSYFFPTDDFSVTSALQTMLDDAGSFFQGARAQYISNHPLLDKPHTLPPLSVSPDREWYRRRGIPYRRGYLLAGPARCGKEFVVRLLASHVGCAVFKLDLAQRTDLTNEMLQRAVQGVNPSSILLLKNVDSVVGRHGRGMASGTSDQLTHSGLLNVLDGAPASNAGVLTVLTTRSYARLTSDPKQCDALLRPGRVAKTLLMELPSPSQIRQLYRALHAWDQEAAVREARKRVGLGRADVLAEAEEAYGGMAQAARNFVAHFKEMTEEASVDVATRVRALGEDGAGAARDDIAEAIARLLEGEAATVGSASASAYPSTSTSSRVWHSPFEMEEIKGFLTRTHPPELIASGFTSEEGRDTLRGFVSTVRERERQRVVQSLERQEKILRKVLRLQTNDSSKHAQQREDAIADAKEACREAFSAKTGIFDPAAIEYAASMLCDKLVLISELVNKIQSGHVESNAVVRIKCRGCGGRLVRAKFLEMRRGGFTQYGLPHCAKCTAPGYPVFCCMPSGRENGREGEGDVDCAYSRGGKAKGEYGEMYHDEVYCEECSQEIDGGGSRTKVRQKKKTKKRLGRRRS